MPIWIPSSDSTWLHNAHAYGYVGISERLEATVGVSFWTFILPDPLVFFIFVLTAARLRSLLRLQKLPHVRISSQVDFDDQVALFKSRQHIEIDWQW